MLRLAAAHGASGDILNLPSGVKLHAQERTMTMADLAQWSASGRLLEAFAVGTAVVVAGIGRIGMENDGEILLPKQEGAMGPIAHAIFDKRTAIQEGKEAFEDWSVLCH